MRPVVCSLFGPGEGDGTVTSQGHPRTIFRRALERGNYLVAVTTAREVGSLDLREALELLNLIALNEPRLYDRAAKRWLGRLLEERSELELRDVQFAVACLTALPSRATHAAAVAVLRALISTGRPGAGAAR